MRTLRCICAGSIAVASALACADASPQVAPTGVAAGSVEVTAPLQTFGPSGSGAAPAVSSDVAPGYAAAGGTSSNVAPATTSIVTTTGATSATTVPALLTTPTLQSTGLAVPTVTTPTSGGAASPGGAGASGGVSTSGSPTFLNDLLAPGRNIP